MRRLVESSSAVTRLEAAADAVRAAGDAPVLVVGASRDAAAALIRRALPRGAARVGHRPASLVGLAAELARSALATRGLAPASRAVVEAVVTRVTHELARAERLGRFQALAERPGLARALARTITELRRDGARPDDDALGAVYDATEAALVDAALVDAPRIFELATGALEAGDGDVSASAHLVLLDLDVGGRAETAFVAALAGRTRAVVATVPRGDGPATAALASALGVAAEPRPPAGPLAALAARLFEPEDETPAAPSDALRVLSAPGEAREAVELARVLVAEAARGVAFDRLAVLARTEAAAAHVAEALARAGVPTYLPRGTRHPHPAGRAFVALLACAAEGVSARRFAEYVSLGEVPARAASDLRARGDATDEPAAPPPAFAPPDDELLEGLVSRGTPEAEAPLPAPPPNAWERLLVDAAVIGGHARWARRLAGLREELRLDREAVTEDDAQAARLDRERAALAELEAFALPIVDALAALPESAPWGAWLERLADLAARALRSPSHVLSLLAELAPMASVGPVGLREVRLVLEPRLLTIARRDDAGRAGRVFVGTCHDARGASFEVVAVPGLAEKLFPRRVTEDPLAPDALRARTSPALDTQETRAARERLALRLAVGAAERAVVLSYSRLDAEAGRPRTPSFYLLEALRAAEGYLPGHEELADRAGRAAGARIGWPAPDDPTLAIDDAEHDLAVLAAELAGREEQAGGARYLLEASPTLARALRFRAARWLRRFGPADGLVDPPADAARALAAHQLAARSYSATALQNYAACPYRFFLSALLKLAPREEPGALEDLDALTKGTLFHEVAWRTLTDARGAGLLPLDEAKLPAAFRVLERAVADVVGAHHDRLAPAIERVWDDAVAGIAADLREWLRRTAREPRFAPLHFELSFGLADRREEDPASRDEPVALPQGLVVRGSIDLVERDAHGALRATDFKTGKVRARPGVVIGGGEVLQPVLYALALEQMFPGTRVEGGRLFYATVQGEFTEVDVPLDGAAREAGGRLAATLGDALARGFFPAAPSEGACTYCDHRPVCGPHEEARLRAKRSPKVRDALAPLTRLRSEP